jgi:hypothetical protein
MGGDKRVVFLRLLDEVNILVRRDEEEEVEEEEEEEERVDRATEERDIVWPKSRFVCERGWWIIVSKGKKELKCDRIFVKSSSL